MLALTLALLQVSVRPTAIVPALHERVAVRVANPSDTAVTRVHVNVPDVLVLLGADAPPGWTVRVVDATDTSSQVVEWTGGSIARREFREFAFLVRLPADARRNNLVLPVRLGRAAGTDLVWGPGTGSVGAAPELGVEGSVGVTPRGAFMLAAGAAPSWGGNDSSNEKPRASIPTLRHRRFGLPH